MSTRPASWTLVLLAGCSSGPQEPHWSENLTPSGPCWEVNLVDGVDEASTDELHALFACLNRSGNLDALTGLDEAMDSEGRSGQPIGLTVARIANDLPTSGYDIFGLAGKALQLFQEHHDDVGLVLEAAVESIYGIPYTQIDENFDLGAGTNLEEGVILPAIDLSSAVATALLDEGNQAREEMIDALDSELIDAGTCTLAGVVYTDDPELKPVGDELMANLAEAWNLAQNVDNDLWTGASGNSIKDLIEFLNTGDDPGPMDELSPILSAMMNDDVVQRNTKLALKQAATAGHIQYLPAQLQHLADVNANGNPLSSGTAGDVSALQAGARLLHYGNAEVECTIEIPIFPDIEFSLGNFSVSVLRRMALMDEDTAVDSVQFLGDVLDFGLTQAILDSIVGLGEEVCPILNADLVADLVVVERLNDPEVGNLVAVIHGLLDAVYQEGELDRLQETVDMMSVLYTSEMLPPVEEVLRDLAVSNLADDMTIVVETVIDPSALDQSACASGVEPLNFDLLWRVTSESFADSSGSNALGRVTQRALEHPALWTFFDNGARLAAQPEARVHQLPELVVNVLLGDQDGIGLEAIRTTVGDPDIWNPGLELLESPELGAALKAPNGAHEGPLPFIARLVRSDTVTVMLQTIDLLLDSLDDD